ncbi:MAG TPA: hypothetical protein VF857_10830 [Spirochaetota bacterium]
MQLFSTIGETPTVADTDIDAYAVISAMGPTCIMFQISELASLADEFRLSKESIKNAIESMIFGAVQIYFHLELSESDALDLVPVRLFQE